ncbi:MAG: hypothetical protein F6K40_00915 [Okeania sp. SIO3I5]|uniref:2OG-Fe(II) oxygenase family protein n=1 Tax=Okeania sp. SIO3I5 TaxID=2607805 RepID=UPI0013B974AF|nr:2OG-Fe(II) oxygenase family protein [Okeania sp. SIO3I5]NEQ34945.1 hypothetical protein [Okeania sp. SIO3I5]
MYGPNLWPEKLPDYKNVITNYIFYLKELGTAILRGLCISLGMQEDFFIRQFIEDPYWLFRILCYPEQSTKGIHYLGLDNNNNNERKSEIEINSDYSCGEHTDYGCITLLLANKKGLEVKSRSGKWFSIEPLEGAFICLIGDMIEYWTNGLYVATKHRVITKDERISMAFFHQPNYETILQPCQIINRGRNEIGTPIKYGEYVYKKYKVIYQ